MPHLPRPVRRLAVALSGIALGLMAGIGAVYAPEKIGLNPDYSGSTQTRKLLTIAYYTTGGLIAGLVAASLDKK